jgi:hypothetical protein
MSRSVTVTVAYIMSVTNLNWKEALKVVRAGRAVANPNLGFQKQLQDFEATRMVKVIYKTSNFINSFPGDHLLLIKFPTTLDVPHVSVQAQRQTSATVSVTLPSNSNKPVNSSKITGILESILYHNEPQGIQTCWKICLKRKHSAQHFSSKVNQLGLVLWVFYSKRRTERAIKNCSLLVFIQDETKMCSTGKFVRCNRCG